MYASTNNNEVPENGFYYHYKHDPLKGVANYAYDVIGVGRLTGEDCWDEDKEMVVYRRLYEDSEFKGKEFFWLRPKKIFMENVIKDGKTFPRFIKINDEKIITALTAIKKKMYGARNKNL